MNDNTTDNTTTTPTDPTVAATVAAAPEDAAAMESTTAVPAKPEETTASMDAPAPKEEAASPAPSAEEEEAAPPKEEPAVKTETALAEGTPAAEKPTSDATVAPDKTTTDAPVVEPVACDTTAEAEAPPVAVTSAAATEAATSKRPVVTTTSEATASEPEPKRQRPNEEGEGGEILDMCAHMGYQPGDRLEVEWQVEDDNGKMVNKWWGCTILEFDGRTMPDSDTDEPVAVRVLDYDPDPEQGFTERSREDVVFMGHDLLISANGENGDHPEFRFRAEGQVRFGNEEEARAAINGILMETLNKHADKWKNLDRSQQNFVANGIAQKKELLVNAIMDHSKSAVITGTAMQQILQGIMQKR